MTSWDRNDVRTRVARGMCIASLWLVPTTGNGQSAGSERVSAVGQSMPFVTKSGVVDGQIEASAVAALGDGARVLVAHDRITGLLVVERATGRIVGDPVSCRAFPESANSKQRPKWEALARDDEGVYYVIGSHSGTEEERAARAYLFQFRVIGDGSDAHPARIDESSVRRWHVDESIMRLLQAEGLDSTAIEKRKVEGLAVRTRRAPDGTLKSRELVIGLREPDDLVRVLSCDITARPADGAQVALKRAFAFSAGMREGVNLQLCSLEHVNHLSEPGFIVLCSTEDEANRFHGNVMWFVPDSDLGQPRLIWEFEPSMKVEGISALPGERAQFVLVYDNDPNKTQIPSRIQTISFAR